MTSGGDHPTADLLDLAVSVAREAADVLLTHRRRMDDGADLGIRTKTSSTDPVSVADADSERLIIGRIADARPQDGLLGEEGTDHVGTSGLRWVVDPLDGTVNYLYGHPGWAVSIAVEAQDGAGGWDGLVGVVLDPTADALFTGVAGAGASLDGSVLAVNDPVPLSQALVATGFSYDRDHRRSQARTVSTVLERARDVRRVGSAALDLCAVAAGRVDAYYEDSTQRWDWAAGAVIAMCAGAVVTPLVGPSGTNGVLAAGPGLHPELSSVLADEGVRPA